MYLKGQKYLQTLWSIKIDTDNAEIEYNYVYSIKIDPSILTNAGVKNLVWSVITQKGIYTKTNGESVAFFDFFKLPFIFEIIKSIDLGYFSPIKITFENIHKFYLTCYDNNVIINDVFSINFDNTQGGNSPLFPYEILSIYWNNLYSGYGILNSVNYKIHLSNISSLEEYREPIEKILNLEDNESFCIHEQPELLHKYMVFEAQAKSFIENNK